MTAHSTRIPKGKRHVSQTSEGAAPSRTVDTSTARSRSAVVRWLLITIALGLASRRFPEMLPRSVALYAGDVLWAAMVYWWLALIWPRARVATLAAAALAIAVTVELSQLWRTPWLDAVRAHPIGALVLGQGFLWSDIACYIAGVALAVLIDRNAVALSDARALDDGV